MKTIKFLAIAILAIVISSSAFAGDKIGLRAGYQMGNLFNGTSNFSGNMNSFYFGVFKEIKLIPLIRFGVGVDYMQTGSVENSDNKIALQYINVPLNLKVKLGPFFALAGVAPSFKVSEQWTVLGEKDSPTSEQKSNIFDLPIFAGVGFKIAVLTIEARYYWGSQSVNDNISLGFEGYKNQYFQLGLGISI